MSAFATLDSDLWPWEKKTGRPRAELKKLYDDAGVRVYSDFMLTSPERPEGFGQDHSQLNGTFPRARIRLSVRLYAIASKNSGGKLSRGTSGHVFSLNLSGLLVQEAWDLTTIICRASTAIN